MAPKPKCSVPRCPAVPSFHFKHQCCPTAAHSPRPLCPTPHLPPLPFPQSSLFVAALCPQPPHNPSSPLAATPTSSLLPFPTHTTPHSPTSCLFISLPPPPPPPSAVLLLLLFLFTCRHQPYRFRASLTPHTLSRVLRVLPPSPSPQTRLAILRREEEALREEEERMGRDKIKQVRARSACACLCGPS